MNRCYICDYTHDDGSDYADLMPSAMRVHEQPNGDFLCTECLGSYEDNLSDLSEDDEQDTTD